MLLENIDFDLTYDFTRFDNHILEHDIYNRPWGFYKSTILTSHAQGKVITLFPKSELSLQEHKKREEHWVIIKGKGKMIRSVACSVDQRISPEGNSVPSNSALLTTRQAL